MFLDQQGDINTIELTERAIQNFRRLTYSPDTIDILPENLPPRPWYLGGEWHQHGFMTAEDMVSFCSELNLGLVYDVCHAFLYCSQYKINLIDYTRTVLPYIRHVHISDARGISGEGVQVGKGQLDFVALFNVLKDVDFSWVPEVWSGHLHHGAGMYTALLELEKYGKAL